MSHRYETNASSRKPPSTSPNRQRSSNPSQPVSLAGRTTKNSTPSASDTATTRYWSALTHALGFSAVPPPSREASSALKLSAVMPSASVSNRDTAPRTTGRPSGFTRRVIDSTAARGSRASRRDGARPPRPASASASSRPRSRPGRRAAGTAWSLRDELNTAPGTRGDRVRTGAGEGPLLVGGLGGRDLRVALAEAIHAACLVEQLLLAGEERVAVGADVQVHHAVTARGLERGARGPLRPTAVAVELAGLVDRMDAGFHVKPLRSRRRSPGPGPTPVLPGLDRVRRREAGVSRALRLGKSRVGDYGASRRGCPFAAPPMTFGAVFRAAESRPGALGSLRDRLLAGARERRPGAAVGLGREQLVDVVVAVDGRGVVREQSAGVCRGSVSGVHGASEQAQQHGQLAAMVCAVRDPAEEHPGAGSLHIEEVRVPLPPLRGHSCKARLALGRGGRVVAHEAEPAFVRGQCRQCQLDAEHRAHPRVFRDALVDHVLERRARALRATEAQVVIAERRPRRERLQPLGVVGVDEEPPRAGIGHGSLPRPPRAVSYEFMFSRNFLFVLVSLILATRNSIASIGFSSVRNLRRIHTFDSTSPGSSSSSLRVPDRLMSIAGKMRLSAILRSSTSSEFPVPLNSSKMTSSMREPVSISAVAMIVSEPPPSMLRALPKKRFGRCSAFASTPPERILPECGTTALCARASRVIESRRITTSRPCSTKRLAFSITISATWTWRAGGSSKVEEMTSPLTERCMSVTSSGRSSISSTISTTSGWFVVMELAMFCNSMVLPVRGGATISPRCPLPTGVSRSITRALTFSRTVSSFRRSCGYSGVRLSNRILLRASSGDSKLTASILTRAKYFSPSCGGRTWPLMVSPVFRSNLRIWEGET